MPRKGENLLPRFVNAIVNGQGWSFGIPFMAQGAAALALPILRTSLRPRRYVLAEEVAIDIRADDLGRTDRIRIRNDAGSRVLLRPGALFRGGNTQSRGTTAGTILNPRSQADVDVKCVHASYPVVEGAILELSRGAAPDGVLQALLLRDQGLVWASVHEAISRTDRRPAGDPDRGRRPPASDDLIDALSDPAIDDPAFEGLATSEDQCGVVILDAHGAIATELFDSPDSWKASSLGILGRYADLLRPNPASPVKARVDPETAVGLTKDFLKEIEEASGPRVPWQRWAGNAPLAEYTTLDGEVIHLLACRPGSLRDRARPSFPDSERDGRPETIGSPESSEPPGSVRHAAEGMGTEDGEVAVAGAMAVSLQEDSEPSPPPSRVMKRKVLTSGWDPLTFRALEHYSRKEFRGDRSGAMRFLVRHGLQRRGYLGPQSIPEAPPSSMSILEMENASPGAELGRAKEETRIRDLERIAGTGEYAGWLRKRARLELERIASVTEDGPLRSAAQAALERIPPTPSPAEIQAVEPVEPPPPAPTVDVTGLLRRALTASAAGNYAQALTLFDEALEAEPFNTTALLGRAVAFRRAGKKQEALAGLDLVLRLEPRNAAALLNRGRLLLERGDLKDALETFDLLVKVAPKDWDVWKERGDVLLRMGEDDEALRSYAEALRRNPEDEDLQRRTRTMEKLRSGPTPGRLPQVTLPPGVEEGQSYLVKERRPEISYRVFQALAAQKVPSLLITRHSLDRVRQDPSLAAVRLLGLSHARGANLYSPAALISLSRAIERFVEESHGQCVILLDGLETLVASNDFRTTLLFIEHINELVVQGRAIFLLSVPPESFPEKEMALLERGLKMLS